MVNWCIVIVIRLTACMELKERNTKEEGMHVSHVDLVCESK